MSLPGIGVEGVKKLRTGKVLVVGCGALGSLCAMYLAASGVGTVGIADFDTVDISNLQRQLFYDEQCLGQPKCSTLAARIRAINSGTRVNEYSHMINESCAAEIFVDYDFIIDGSDNPSTKYMTSAVCQKLGIPYCIGGVREFGGQVMSWSPGHAGYGDLFGETPRCSGFMPCSVAGVLGPTAGVTASVQASEAIKYLTGSGEMLYDKLFAFDLGTTSASVYNF